MPGVPPNAFSKLKQAFKGMLKPKKRQSQQDQKQDEQQNTAAKPDVPPKLPPTHPLATGQHSEPQIAVPKPEASSAPDAGSDGVAATQQSQKLGEDKAPVSPAGPTPIAKDDALKSEPVSAVSSEHGKPLPLPKTDGANDEVKSAAAPLPSQPSTQDSQPVGTKNAKPTVTTPAPATAADVQPTAKSSSESARIVDEKMAVMTEEPPEIKTKAAAPGMSATSGPLDDFPMEGDKP